jgi:hypothetical protein
MFRSVFWLIVLFGVLFLCKCVLYYCHQVLTKLQLNIYYIILYNIIYHIIYYISYHVIYLLYQCTYTWQQIWFSRSCSASSSKPFVISALRIGDCLKYANTFYTHHGTFVPQYVKLLRAFSCGKKKPFCCNKLSSLGTDPLNTQNSGSEIPVFQLFL